MMKLDGMMMSDSQAPSAFAESDPDADKPKPADTRRLVVVSNRVPVGKPGAGGLAVGLRDALEERQSVWFGWSGEISDGPSEEIKRTEGENITYAVIDLSQQQYDGYYAGYSNKALWPAFHYRLDLSDFRDRDYQAYRSVNAQFARCLARVLQPYDIIWVHDYHMLMLAHELRERGVKNPIGFFSHIPFPAPEIFQAVPQHQELMAGLMAFDLVGFQSERDRRNFERSVIERGNGVFRPDGSLYAFGRTSLAKAFPIGLNVEDFAALVDHEEEGDPNTPDPREDTALIIGVDRMDYSKGIPQRIDAISELFDDHPELKGKATFLQITPPSRGEVEAYANLRLEIESQVGHINGAHATLEWSPVQFVATLVERSKLANLYRRARVGLVTPLRDGMNLVAKEFLACQDPDDPGVLVLSEFAGAAEQLQDALIVNPHDINGVARAIYEGLNMPLDERRRRHGALMDVLEKHDAKAWSGAFLKMLEARAETGSGLMSPVRKAV